MAIQPIQAVMIDDRELQYIPMPDFGEDVPVFPTRMEFADLQILCKDGKTLLIERCTPDDFCGKIPNKRIVNQAHGMHKLSPWSYIVITGAYRHNHEGKIITDGRGITEWDWRAIEGEKLSLYEMGVPVVHSAGPTDYVDCVIRLARRDRDGNTRISPVRPAQELGTDVAFLCGLPGIGNEKAIALLQHCGTVAWALCALSSGINLPKGFGQGTVNNIRKFLSLTDTYTLWELPIEELQ